MRSLEMKQFPTHLLILLLVGIFVVACARGEEGGGGLDDPEVGAGTVDVELSEYVIRMPESIQSGPTEFVVTNAGTEEHNFEIEGQGIEEELETNLQPGETGTLQVDLEPGTYTIYCPVNDHREHGMELTLTVQ